ncbi:MAG: hypothetical protein ACYDBJ_18215 [Aggregatilineales bacterium]
MARNKKSKRPNLPQESLERARAELRGEAVPLTIDTNTDEVAAAPIARPKVKAVTSSPAAKVKRTGSTIVRRIPTIEALLEEYGYVLRNLRHLAILAGSLLIAIVVISFVLSHV